MAILALTGSPTLLASLTAEFGPEEFCLESRPAHGLTRAQQVSWSVVLIDSDFVGDATLELIERIGGTGQPVALMTRAPSLRTTLAAMDRGARDVLPFPPDAGKLRDLIMRCHRGSARATVAAPMTAEAGETIVGESAPMLEAFKTIA